MNMELLMQYVTCLLMAIGVLAFLTSVITQVIKEMPGLKNPDKCSGICGGLDLVPVGSCDSMHIL